MIAFLNLLRTPWSSTFPHVCFLLFLGQTLAEVSAEETIEGSGEDMGSGEVDNDEAEELPLPEEIISLLGRPLQTI